MQPRIEILEEKKLIGMSATMSVLENKTGQLWATFGPQIKNIRTRINTNKISLQVYPTSYFKEFNPAAKFEKWALVEVSDFDTIPVGLKTFTIGTGMYAVFHYKGSSADAAIFQYIYGQWIPNSEFTLDERPHFEVLGEKYQNNRPDSEEEIWIPIRAKV